VLQSESAVQSFWHVGRQTPVVVMPPESPAVGAPSDPVDASGAVEPSGFGDPSADASAAPASSELPAD
jgi:hypothetical protein